DRAGRPHAGTCTFLAPLDADAGEPGAPDRALGAALRPYSVGRGAEDGRAWLRKGIPPHTSRLLKNPWRKRVWNDSLMPVCVGEDCWDARDREGVLVVFFFFLFLFFS